MLAWRSGLGPSLLLLTCYLLFVTEENSYLWPAGDPSSKPNLHLANRLDRDTSGLMVITKCNKVAAKLVKAFTEHKVKKTYLALCVGYPPAWEKIKICSGHGRSKHGAWRVYAMADVGRTLPGGSSVRGMSTKFEVLGTDGKGQYREPSDVDIDDIESITVQEKAADQTSRVHVKNHMVFVRAYPQSGRTHQIRLHCQYLGFPIRGDVKYGGVIEWNGVDCDGHALHAESLSFVHPVTGLPVTFRAPLPSWADEVISTMGWNFPWPYSDAMALQFCWNFRARPALNCQKHLLEVLTESSVRR